jgi:hypothetical protein
MATLAIIGRSAEEAPGAGIRALRYAIEQLARRAGVDDKTFASWRFDWSESGFVSVYVQPGTRKRIRFPRMRAAIWEQIQGGVFNTSTAGWWRSAMQLRELVPDFKIPFSSSKQSDLGSLFTSDSPDSHTCAVDLPTSSLLTLSRFEETLPSPKDIHGRFQATSCVAWQGGFLHRPIVDEYGLALEQVLRALLPGWDPPARHLRVKVSHDVDDIGLPFSFRSAAAKMLRHGRPLCTARDVAAAVLRIETASQRLLRHLVQLSTAKKLDTAVNWKCSKHGPYDTGYDLHDGRILRFMEDLMESGVELGIHPSYVTFQSPKLLRAEVESLSELLGNRKLGGRQDYLRWSPQTWVEWDSLGLAYDSTVGFADHVGFRAGTCFPYQPWLWSEQRKAVLIEIPLLVMDSMLFGYMKLSAEQAQMVVLDLVDRCRAVGGVFTVAWHNTSLLNLSHTAIYRTLVQRIAEGRKYDWRTASA